MGRVPRWVARLLVLATVLLLVASQAGWEPTTGRIRQGAAEAAVGSIRAATTPPFAPWQYRDQSGRLTGFEVEMLRDIGRRINRDIEFIDVQWEGALAGLQANKFDVVASAIAIICERAQAVDFTVPYYEFGVSVTARRNDPRLRRVEDLKGLVVGVGGAGSTSHLWLLRNRFKYDIREVRVYETNAAAMLDLQAGRIDAVAQNLPSQVYYIRDKPMFEIRLRGLTSGFTGMAFRKGDPLVPQFNTAIDAMKRDGTMARLHREQFGADAPADSASVKLLPPVQFPATCPTN